MTIEAWRTILLALGLMLVLAWLGFETTRRPLASISWRFWTAVWLGLAAGLWWAGYGFMAAGLALANAVGFGIVGMRRRQALNKEDANDE